MCASRLEAVPSSKLAEQRQHRLDKNDLQVREPMKGVFRAGLVVNRFGKAELQNKRPCHALNTHLSFYFHLVVYNVYPTQ